MKKTLTAVAAACALLSFTSFCFAAEPMKQMDGAPKMEEKKMDSMGGQEKMEKKPAKKKMNKPAMEKKTDAGMKKEMKQEMKEPAPAMK